jgi:hypothetical protein
MGPTRHVSNESARGSEALPDLDADVLAKIRRDILDPDLARDVVRRALELRASRPTVVDERKALRAELERVEVELARYAEAIGAGDAMPALLEAMRTRERRRAELTAQLAGLSERQAVVTPADVYRKLSQRLTDWYGTLDRHPARARDILRLVLAGRLVVTPRPDEHVFEWRGEASYGALLQGLVSVNGLVPPG